MNNPRGLEPTALIDRDGDYGDWTLLRCNHPSMPGYFTWHAIDPQGVAYTFKGNFAAPHDERDDGPGCRVEINGKTYEDDAPAHLLKRVAADYERQHREGRKRILLDHLRDHYKETYQQDQQYGDLVCDAINLLNERL